MTREVMGGGRCEEDGLVGLLLSLLWAFAWEFGFSVLVSLLFGCGWAKGVWLDIRGQ